MQQAAEAHRQLESGTVRERIILTSSNANGGAAGKGSCLWQAAWTDMEVWS